MKEDGIANSDGFSPVWDYGFAAGFMVFLFVFETLWFGPEIIKETLGSFKHDNFKYFVYLRVLFLVSISFPFLFVLFARRSSIISKVLLLIFSAIILIFEYSYRSAIGRYSTPDEIELGLFYTESTVVLHAFGAYLNPFSIISISVLAFVIFFRSKKRGSGDVLLLGSVLASVFFFSAIVLGFSNWVPSSYSTVSVSNGIRSLSEVLPFTAVFRQSERETPPVPSRSEAAYRNIVFIVDESVNAANLDVYGYNRDTTPVVDELQRKGLINVLSETVSGATCSQASSYLLMTGIRTEQLPDVGRKKLRTAPTLFSYAKTGGYETHFFDGSSNAFWLSPYLTGKIVDRKEIDQWRNRHFFRKKTNAVNGVDKAIAAEVLETVRNGKKNFIWVWKRGVHIPYKQNISEGEGKFGTETETDAYDSAIESNLNPFFETIAPLLSEPDTLVIYTSDHGQKLDDDPATSPHCGTDPASAEVPLFTNRKLNISSDAEFSHSNIFGTLLKAIGHGDVKLLSKYAPDLENAKSNERYFWGSNLEKGEAIKFNE